MFKKILVACRGEIAVRLVRACHELGIPSLVPFRAVDVNTLPVRLSDECALLDSHAGLGDPDSILRLAREKGADALHPGYGFLAGLPDFIRACEAAGVCFIGPPAEVVEMAVRKVEALERVRSAGFRTVEFAALDPVIAANGAGSHLRLLAEQLGYPLVVKAALGGRGHQERLVSHPDRLEEALRSVQAQALSSGSDPGFYLERAILPTRQVSVQVLCDRSGGSVHLGERQGVFLPDNRMIAGESPAPCLTPRARERLCADALEIARLFRYESAGTVEFLVDVAGKSYFTEIKAHLQPEHSLAEMIARVDLVREQVHLAGGGSLTLQQGEINLQGWAIMGQIYAETPCRGSLPARKRLQRARMPSGPHVRVDTHVYTGCDLPSDCDPLMANLIAWGDDRQTALLRMRRALDECKLIGAPTNLALLQRVFQASEFIAGRYDNRLLSCSCQDEVDLEARFRDLAVAASILYVHRNLCLQPSLPESMKTEWHRNSRRLTHWLYGGLIHDQVGGDH